MLSFSNTIFNKNFHTIFSKYFSQVDKALPDALKYSYPFSKTVLNNGIRVCTETIKSPIVSLGIFINSGSRYESEDASGSAHFLEHILFKGTKYQKKREFEMEVEQMGSSLNAYTSREHTLFHIECFPSNMKRCLKILSDMMQFPLISKKAVEEEKDTIITELNTCYSDPNELIMEMGHRTVFGDKSAMGRPILGEIKNINNVTQNMVKQFHKRQYIGDNIMVIACGDVNHQNLVKDVTDCFKSLRKTSPIKKNQFSLITPKFLHNTITYIYNEHIENPGIGLFYPSPNWYHEDYYVLLLIERILGKNNNNENLVFNSFNHTKNIDNPLSQYSNLTNYRSFFNPYKDCGLFGIMTPSYKHSLNDIQILSKFFPYQYASFISDDEIERAKNTVYAELLSIQSPTELLNLIGTQIIYLNRRISRLEIAKKVSSITNEQVRNAFTKYFVNGNPSIVAYGQKNIIENITKYYINYANSLLVNNARYIKH